MPMDPVNKKAVKKDFEDRKDQDIDNDGDVDSSDEYLHKRRKAVSKAIKNVKESVELEDLDEATDPKEFFNVAKRLSDISKDIKTMSSAARFQKKITRDSVNDLRDDIQAIYNDLGYMIKDLKKIRIDESVELDESDDARIQRSLDAHKFKQAAKVKAGIPLRRPGESLAAYVTRKAKAQAKMQKEETEQDRINKAAERAHAWRSKIQTGNLSKSEKKRINKAANKANRAKSFTREDVELDEANKSASDFAKIVAKRLGNQKKC